MRFRISSLNKRVALHFDVSSPEVVTKNISNQFKLECRFSLNYEKKQLEAGDYESNTLPENRRVMINHYQMAGFS